MQYATEENIPHSRVRRNVDVRVGGSPHRILHVTITTIAQEALTLIVKSGGREGTISSSALSLGIYFPVPTDDLTWMS